MVAGVRHIAVPTILKAVFSYRRAAQLLKPQFHNPPGAANSVRFLYASITRMSLRLDAA
jgi:hypothetical protein